jgi:hypothetical protein
MGRPKRCAKRPSPYISYTPVETAVTTTTINPLDDPNNYIVIPQSGVDCVREIDPCPCGELFIPKGSGTNYIVIDNDYGSWGTYDSKTLIATLNSSSVDNYLHAEDVYIESGETFKTITSRRNSIGDFYLDNFSLQIVDSLNEIGDGYEEHPFIFNNRIKVALKSKEDNEVFAEKYFGSIGSTSSLNKLILNNQDFFKRMNIIGKTLILEIYSVCDFDVEKCIPDASLDPITTTSTTTSTSTTSTSTSTTSTSTSTTSTSTSTTSTTTSTTTNEPNPEYYYLFQNCNNNDPNYILFYADIFIPTTNDQRYIYADLIPSSETPNDYYYTYISRHELNGIFTPEIEVEYTLIDNEFVFYPDSPISVGCLETTTSTTTSTTSTTTSTTTTTTTTEQPPDVGDYEAGYYCLGGVECDPPSCMYHEGGPIYTWCNTINGPYATSEECESNCQETTTTSTTSTSTSTTSTSTSTTSTSTSSTTTDPVATTSVPTTAIP